ncbi:transketolase [Gammaproteobacteria bacterium]|nr:transketolase [Gammaproteobacteria bacterium]MDA9175258.1 transketolase [Gammaproteobacteria bacterium]MDA9834606.1 transketolase [Gammaproteobacteria bacterium]MDA9979391.1 transketolase [Gammaproteobacteria bacterium]MDC3371978.1 transketolase [Gammaproteobacteria bacterium]
MGDQVGQAVTGKLYFVEPKEFQRILSQQIPLISRAEIFSALCRINTLYMIANAGSGHIGSSFSSMDIMSWIYLMELEAGSINLNSEDPSGIFFSSKGHDAPALYNVLIGLQKLDFEYLHKLRRIDGLPGHPDINTPNIITNTGSLGMGISKAKGMIAANRLQNKNIPIYVLTGDGEMQEGQFWESLVSAANHNMDELTVIIDHNKLQSDTLISKVSDLGDIESKLQAFNWHVLRCDGNNIQEFSDALDDAKKAKGQPSIIISDTVKGKGVSFMEHTSIDSDVELYKFHSGAPSSDAYSRAAQELIEKANDLLRNNNLDGLELESFQRDLIQDNNQKPKESLIAAYSDALMVQAKDNNHLIALDADLILDTGLIPFKNSFPNQFIECGIAEQDMVSQAGGMAIAGALPIVHSFSCFLSARPNEQIYNNATEGNKIIYVGSLAGIIPAGPGHSHQAVRDISSLGAIPNLTIVEPANEKEVELALDWAINKSKSSTYIRLFSPPIEIKYNFSANHSLKYGCGTEIKSGQDILIIAYGPLMISEAILAADLIEESLHMSAKVINLPWLNHVNQEWLESELSSMKYLISIDNHFQIGAQGDRLSSALIKIKLNLEINFHHIFIPEIPQSGSNEEVLEAAGIDSKSIALSTINFIKKHN